MNITNEFSHTQVQHRAITHAWFVKPRQDLHGDDGLPSIAQPLSHTAQVRPRRSIDAAAKIANPELDHVQHTAHTTDDATDLQILRSAVASGSNEQIVVAAKQLVANAGPLPNHSAQLLTVKQIAMTLNCSTRSVWRLVAEGELPQPMAVGHLRRWNPADIETYLTGKRDLIQRQSRN